MLRVIFASTLSHKGRQPSLLRFVERCLIPYLYGFSYFQRHQGKLPFGELAHGAEGIRQDYKDLFGVESGESAVDVSAGLDEEARCQ